MGCGKRDDDCCVATPECAMAAISCHSVSPIQRQDHRDKIYKDFTAFQWGVNRLRMRAKSVVFTLWSDKQVGSVSIVVSWTPKISDFHL